MFSFIDWEAFLFVFELCKCVIETILLCSVQLGPTRWIVCARLSLIREVQLQGTLGLMDEAQFLISDFFIRSNRVFLGNREEVNRDPEKSAICLVYLCKLIVARAGRQEPANLEIGRAHV